ncbi:flagellar biosynthesis regulator FlaF [Parvularcula sp. LCG005]|uniref:flagellar biosynthesis regulator FlaF n=1 Tax=Parvularcula sp. LCG005 TaxID=3078805 RepID=UPI0029433363|nr:flagellar biosynthesis regulator FlaF [Parvularcula sp. LCG005]WOI52681.1 flagellar biosynthesis regulator FlaF [Parvularcula sp. LCG005]
MKSLAEAGYGQVRRQTAEPRQIEYQILTKIASDLEAAAAQRDKLFPQLMNALQRNTALWTAFATDLMSKDNQCTDEVKARMIGLAKFSIRHAQAVMAGNGDVSPLIEVNRTVAAGLRQAAEAA